MVNEFICVCVCDFYIKKGESEAYGTRSEYNGCERKSLKCYQLYLYVNIYLGPNKNHNNNNFGNLSICVHICTVIINEARYNHDAEVKVFFSFFDSLNFL